MVLCIFIPRVLLVMLAWISAFTNPMAWVRPWIKGLRKRYADPADVSTDRSSPSDRSSTLSNSSTSPSSMSSLAWRWHFCKNSLYSLSKIINWMNDISARLARPFGGSFKWASWYVKALELRSVFHDFFETQLTSKNWGKEQNWITGFKSRNGRPKSCHTPSSRSILH